jgi:hypothetical protein
MCNNPFQSLRNQNQIKINAHQAIKLDGGGVSAAGATTPARTRSNGRATDSFF